ncbi:hypothetical protein [Kutzneria kofuensis]|uniref:Uncharacterized protein n=1 Tax=Kutzneria kofuensis TaxID=103725 RepID=A0A7W9KMJ7_9PSEU|nr:hypothetical protein [Kutzneria kofuensis]MBB5895227.1 hypothetical protein [Kutzneria kofuensis]
MTTSQAMLPTVRQPGTIMAALIATLVSVAAGVAAAITVYAGGTDMVKSLLSDPDVQARLGLSDDLLNAAKELGGDLFQQVLDQAYGTLSARAAFALVLAVLLLVFGVLARGAALWARILVTVFGVIAISLQLLVVTDIATSSMKLFGLLVILSTVVAVVLWWLPANGRYAKARKAAQN